MLVIAWELVSSVIHEIFLSPIVDANFVGKFLQVKVFRRAWTWNFFFLTFTLMLNYVARIIIKLSKEQKNNNNNGNQIS